MANKEIVIMTVDTGYEMAKPYNEDLTRLQVALECVNMTLQQKIFNNPNHEMGIALFGDDEAEDDNNIMLQSTSKPTLELVKNVQKLITAPIENSKPGGDIFSAIDFMITEIEQHTGTKKYNKRAFLFTHGAGKTTSRPNDVMILKNRLEKNNIKLNIITIDFMEGYDPETNTLSGSSTVNPEHEKNAQLLVKLKADCNVVQIVPASMAIELYRQFRKKQTTPIAQFRGFLQIAPNLSIDVATFKKTRQFKPKSLKKFNLKEEFDSSERTNLIVNDVVYHLEEDPNKEAISQEDLVNGYQYGKDIAAINKTMESASRIYEEKCFRLLGFVPKDKIPRKAFMSNVDIVVPSQNLASRKLFSAFIYSMLSLGRYAVARYIPRNMKNGVNVKFMLLIPYRSAKGQCFYMVELPTASDIRDFQFQSLKEANHDQLEVVKELVGRMNLCEVPDEDGETFEALKPKLTFNPYNQYLFQSLFYRVVNQKDDIPPLNPQIQEYLNIEKKIYPKTKHLMQKIQKLFGITIKEVKEKTNKKLIWSDLIKNAEVSTEASSAQERENLEVVAGAGKKFVFEDQEVSHVNPKDPINTFKKMIANPRTDLVSRALSEMMEFIESKMKMNHPETYQHLFDCMKAMREASKSQKEEKVWDSWLDRAKSNIPGDLLNKLKSEGLGFLEKGNIDLFKVNSTNLKVMVQEIEMDELD